MLKDKTPPAWRMTPLCVSLTVPIQTTIWYSVIGAEDFGGGDGMLGCGNENVTLMVAK